MPEDPPWPPRWAPPPDAAPPPTTREPVPGQPASGRPPSATPPAPAEPGAPVPRGATSRRTILLGAAAALVLVVTGVLVAVRPWESSVPLGNAVGGAAPRGGLTAARGGAGQAATATADGPVTVRASADCESAPSRDAGGNPTSYGAANAVDDRPETAWRCDGDGVGHQLRLDFNQPVTLVGVGVVPGLAKTDPYDGTDRYRQCRRISSVRLTFDSGEGVTANLDPGPDDRAVQHITLPPVTTGSLVLTVTSSVEGEPVGALPPTDKIAISTVTWSAA